MAKPLIVLGGDNGKYFVAQINSEKIDLEPTTEIIDARETVPYDFPKQLDFSRPGYSHEKNRGLSKEEVRRKCLEEAVRSLTSMARKKGADLVLTRILLNQDLGTYWDMQVEAQMLLYTRKEKE